MRLLNRCRFTLPELGRVLSARLSTDCREHRAGVRKAASACGLAVFHLEVQREQAVVVRAGSRNSALRDDDHDLVLAAHDPLRMLLDLSPVGHESRKELLDAIVAAVCSAPR